MARSAAAVRSAWILALALIIMGTPAAAGPSDSLTDEALLAAASQFLNEPVPIVTDVPRHARRQVLGVHQGNRIVAYLPCDMCGPGGKLIYYDAPPARCDDIGGVRIGYHAPSEAPTPYCVPKVLYRAGLSVDPEYVLPTLDDAGLVDRAKQLLAKRLTTYVDQPIAAYRGRVVHLTVACHVYFGKSLECLDKHPSTVIAYASSFYDGWFRGVLKEAALRESCDEMGGKVVVYPLSDDLEPRTEPVCVPSLLVDSGLWRDGLDPQLKPR